MCDKFPSKLDDATVLLHSDRGEYGTVKSTTGEIADEITYLAICAYENDGNFYLFCLNDAFEVVADSLWDSVEQCKQMAEGKRENITWIYRQSIKAKHGVFERR